MRALRWGAVLGLVPFLHAAAPQPSDWVPMRWPWSDPASLELLSGTPINCLLLKTASPEFVEAAAGRGLVTLAVIAPGGDVVGAARRAMAAKVTGIALEGDFPEGIAAGVKETAGGAPVIELTARGRMPLGSNTAILGTYQGVWPGIAVEEDGAKKVAPTGSAWIDTNTGFIRAVRAWGDATLWIANQPPPQTVITGARYLQAIADAAICGARWVLALDHDFAARLARRDAKTMADWERMADLLRYFEQHPEWRRMREYAKLAIVQDPAKGGLVSGGILDMIAARHTPVRPIPRQRLTSEALAGATMAVNVDADALTPEQKEVLRNFTRSGGMLLTGPPGWKDPSPPGDRITFEKAELERLDDIWREVNAMVGRGNMGVRLFNVSSMLSNLLASEDGKTAVVHLVNYSDYPVENVAVHFPAEYQRATLSTPEGVVKSLEIYPTEEGWGVDIDKVSVCATIKLEQQHDP
ncbi:MAG: hypothetical protein ABSH44_10925 [Bryobacteraceae bacterium]